MKSYSKNQLSRYPVYLRVLQHLQKEGVSYVTSKTLSKEVGNSEEQVKKDLAAVSLSNGMPGRGREVISLIDDLETFLGYRESTKAVLIGVGRLGQALLDYPGFRETGLSIVGAFDSDPEKIGSNIGGLKVLPAMDIATLLPPLKAKIAILCVPAAQAQEACEEAVKAGCIGIWNFAPVPLDVRDSAIAENVNLSSSLAVLKHRMKSILKEE